MFLNNGSNLLISYDHSLFHVFFNLIWHSPAHFKIKTDFYVFIQFNSPTFKQTFIDGFYVWKKNSIFSTQLHCNKSKKAFVATLSKFSLQITSPHFSFSFRPEIKTWSDFTAFRWAALRLKTLHTSHVLNWVSCCSRAGHCCPSSKSLTSSRDRNR